MDPNLQALSRRDLQVLAKSYNIKANQASEDIIKKLNREMSLKRNDSSNSNIENESRDCNIISEQIAELKSNLAASCANTKKQFESPLTALMRRVSISTNRPKEHTPTDTPVCKSVETPMENRHSNVESTPDRDDELDKHVDFVVNAIKACENNKEGICFEKICDMIRKHGIEEFNPRCLSVQIHRALREACSSGKVMRTRLANGDIRYSIIEQEPPKQSASKLPKAPKYEAVSKPKSSSPASKLREALIVERQRRVQQQKHSQKNKKAEPLAHYYVCSKCCAVEASPQEPSIHQREHSDQIVESLNVSLDAVVGEEKQVINNDDNSPEQHSKIPRSSDTENLASSASVWYKRESRSKPGRYFYYNLMTRQTTWVCPPELAEA